MKYLLTIVLLLASFSIFGQLKWKDINDIPDKWVMLERDSVDYLVYSPCNGSTPKISIDKNYIVIFWQLDAPDTLSINKFTIGKDNKSFYITDRNGNSIVTVEIKDAKRKLVLWSFSGDNKWVMTPQEFSEDFRKIKNPCPTEMKPEKQFLPIEF